MVEASTLKLQAREGMLRQAGVFPRTQISSSVAAFATVAGFGSVFVSYFMDGPADNFTDLLRNDVDMFVSHRRKLIEEGIYELPVNLKRNHISLAHTEADVDRTLEIVDKVLSN